MGEWRELAFNMVFTSCLLVGGAVLWGLVSLRWYRREGRTSLEQRSRFIRLPLLIVGMAASYAVVLQAPWWSYPIIGVVWGVTYPLRITVSHYLVCRDFDRQALHDPPSWQLAGILVVTHGLLWPLSVPACFILANEFGAFHPPDTDHNE